MTSVARRILLSRLLTRSGDQAWDFAVPLTMVSVLPRGLELAAAYYFLLKLGQLLLSTRVGAIVDLWPRLAAAKLGIGMQVGGMLGAALALIALAPTSPHTAFAVLVILGNVANLGAVIMDIAVAGDIIPTVIPTAELSHVNSRLQQIDLGTEVGAPIVAGLLLMMQPEAFPMLGFALIAVWNVLSFGPEYWLLRSALQMSPELMQRKSLQAPSIAGALARFASEARAFFREPVMPSIVAWACLWMTVLSPHGVLITAFLKESWQLPETMIGVFRGAGAIFGMAATFLFPRFVARKGVVAASRTFVIGQALVVTAAAASFAVDARLGFLVLVLVSRIGLYGFSQGETQIRQRGIPEGRRGAVNGFTSALTSFATLTMYGAGAVLSSPREFHLLVYASAAFVVLGAVIFTLWSRQGLSHFSNTNVVAAGQAD